MHERKMNSELIEKLNRKWVEISIVELGYVGLPLMFCY